MKTKILAQLSLLLAVAFIACSQTGTSSQSASSTDAPTATASGSAAHSSTGFASDADPRILGRARARAVPTQAPPASSDLRTPQQLALAACRRADGSWACPAIKQPLMASGQPITPPAWTVHDWYFDAANGTGCAADTNSCTSATCGGSGIGPCLTVEEMSVHRWGTSSPILAQTTTLHILSSETVGQEHIVLTPTLVTGVNFAIIGTPLAIGAPFSPSGVTSKVRGAPGTLLQLAGMPAGTTAGTLLWDSTRNSYAFIDSMAVLVATMTQPFAAAGLTTVQSAFAAVLVEDDLWAHTDTFQRYSLPILNLELFSPVYGDALNNTYVTPVAWVQSIHVPDTSGHVGYSFFTTSALQNAGMVYSMCWFDPLFAGVSRQEGTLGPADLSCWHNGGASFQGWQIVGGASNSNGTASIDATYVQDLAAVDGDAIIHGGLITKGSYTVLGYAYLDNTGYVSRVLRASAAVIEPNWFAAAQVWGPGTLNVDGGFLENETSGAWATCLTLGTLQLEGATTGCTFNGAAVGNPFVCGIPLTAANIDTGGGSGWPGMQDVLTGGRFAQ
jgi:hypothetical protein